MHRGNTIQSRVDCYSWTWTDVCTWTLSKHELSCHTLSCHCHNGREQKKYKGAETRINPHATVSKSRVLCTALTCVQFVRLIYYFSSLANGTLPLPPPSPKSHTKTCTHRHVACALLHVSLYVCLCIRMHVRRYICIHVNVHWYAYELVYMGMHGCFDVCMCECIYLCVCLFVHMCVCMHVRADGGIYVNKSCTSICFLMAAPTSSNPHTYYQLAWAEPPSPPPVGLKSLYFFVLGPFLRP